jgi:putative NADH-flavin reductase
MKLAVFGATGGTGRQIVRQALNAGHSVTALVRDPARAGIEHANLTLVQGNVLNPADVTPVVAGADAVIVSLGNTADNPEMVVSRGTGVVIQAMQEQGVRRIIVVSSIGVGESKDQVPFVFKMLMGTVLKKAMEDKEAQEILVKATDLEWTIVRPGGLTDGPATGNYRAGTDPAIKAGQVARADVAAFVLRQLEDSQYLRKAPAIT